MIHWLVQSLADHPDLQRGEAPPGLLSQAERARLAGLRVKKRRSDWILGRWTAKHLLQSAFEREVQLRLPLGAFTVDNDPSGAPAVVLDDRQALVAEAFRNDLAASLRTLSLSISHSEGQSFCAVSLMPGTRLGADIEYIVPRSPQCLADFFTPAEVCLVDEAPAALRDTMANAIWSGKEAVLKALHLGLTVDTRRVVCRVALPSDPLDPALFGYRWTRFEIDVEPGVLQAAGFAATGPQAPALAGGWQVLSNYALTLVLLSPAS